MCLPLPIKKKTEREDKPENDEYGYLQSAGGGGGMQYRDGKGLTLLFFIVQVWEACQCSTYSKYKIKSVRIGKEI